MSGDLDKLLAEWPMPPPSDLDRDDAAERVTSAIAARGAGGPELDGLLAAPLPARDSEKNLAAGAPAALSGRASFPSSAGVENKMSKDRGRDRTSFQELAKLAGTPAPQPVTPSLTPAPTGVVRAEEGGSDDSGIVDLKMVAALDPAAQERAKATPLAAQGLFDDDAPASAAAAAASAPPASVSAVAQSSAPAAAASASVAPTPSAAPPASAVASLAPPKKEEKKKGGGGLVLLFGGLLAAGAIAAGAFFVVKSGVLTGSKATVAATAAAKPAETGATATPTATGAATVAAVDTGAAGVDMNSLPGTAPTTTGGRTMPKINAVGGGTKPTTVASADTPAATGTVDPKLVANNIPNSNTGGGGDLTAAMKAAAGGGSANPSGTDTTQTGPQYAAGTVPQKPSQGQVQGAINAVLPEARKCLAEGDPISRATIVFQSDGSVKSVSVSGFAAGKPAEACVQGALKKAKISPFAEATYTFPVTVRAQ